LLNLSASTKEEAIKELSKVLREAGEIKNFAQFLEDVFTREKISSTGIGHGVAIPHARSEAVRDFVIAFGRSQKELEFDAVDNKPVRLIFLMGTPKEKEINAYLKILAHLTRLMWKENFRNSLLTASSPQEVLDAFREVEE
jgi:PTS system fructose-specific IIA component